MSVLLGLKKMKFGYVWIFLGYQFLQLVLNKRFFLFELRVKNGNSLEHTVVKLVEFFVGFLIGTILKYNKLISR
jgi:hypothetical protein